ncbi:LysR family transcriptional regulator [Yinghuangia seranimata]|uniref:LysR family transcriptional regulator n=1 Tax=Yinghuangia seranimata TaxID=408067 RepID=UPI00248C1ACA|nr:LysR family transcriptional regulator [Yinghuangia seranimata]MDI2131611.1 LysR family transcriptional regulator [Yinghuangia seranimata]
MREVEAFLAVADHLHFGRAAEGLGLSTTRVSSLVRAFERRVRVGLFERTSRQVRLTPAGARLYAELCPAYEAMSRAITEIGDPSADGGSVLRVGFATTLPAEFVDETVAAFELRCSEWRVAKSPFPTSEWLRWIGETWPVDVFVTWLPADPALLGLDGVASGPVSAHAPRALVVAAGHPLAGRTSVNAEELAGHAIVAFTEIPEGISRTWTPRTTPDGTPMTLRWLSTMYLERAMRAVTDEGVGHLTFTGLLDRYPMPGVVEIPVLGMPPMAVATVWSDQADARTTHAARWFADIAAEVGATVMPHTAIVQRPAVDPR